MNNNIELFENNNQHSMNFAILYNYLQDTELINSNIKTYDYMFVDHNISIQEFKNIFYCGEVGIFNINEIYKDTPYLSFNKQTIQDSDSTYSTNTLYELIISAYENELNVSRHNMNPIMLMKLKRDILKYRSLYDICNIHVQHCYKDLLNLTNNFSKINNKNKLNLLFIYSNKLFPEIDIRFHFNYVITYLN